MPTILETIREYEEDVLLMIAEAWGIDIELDFRIGTAEQITTHISKDQTREEMFNSLSDKSFQALKMLTEENGKISWDQFTRVFGELREMGAGRRERERPDRAPVSVTETLYYKALIGRAFFETGHGLYEFVFIPDEFFQILKPAQSQVAPNSFKQVPVHLVEKTLLSNDYIIDQACTVLAGLRIGLTVKEIIPFTLGIPSSFLINLLKETKIITGRLEFSSEKVKRFLETGRGSALTQLAKVWKSSQEIDELDLIETLEFEGQRKNKPQTSRVQLLDLIQDLPDESWFGIQEFCDWIHKSHPDILRSGGEYDAWFIKDSATGEYIKGFENWQRVEGKYLRMMILRPLFWMGFVDLGKTAGEISPAVFRKSKWFNALMAGQELEYPTLQKKDFEIQKSGRLTIERFFPRDIRYQLARCCDWESVRSHKFFYNLSPRAFQRMEHQGLKISQLVTLIKHYARKPVPQNILMALERWQSNGQEAGIEKITVLKVKSAEIMDKLLTSPAKKYILTIQNPTTAEIAANSWAYIKAALLDLGVLAEIKPEV